VKPNTAKNNASDRESRATIQPPMIAQIIA
jgi:hypothetical protein